MKRYLILLSIGVLVVIIGAFFKITDSFTNGNTVLICGLAIEVISLVGIVIWWAKKKERPTFSFRKKAKIKSQTA